jgi:hypothetical protein
MRPRSAWTATNDTRTLAPDSPWRQVPSSVDLRPGPPLAERRERQLIWTLLGLGILARTIRR